jgi:hypothetical protein
MPECESNKQALAHRVLSISHILQSSLFFMHFLILSHISFITEVIEVASIRLRVKLWNERSALGAKSGPINLCKILMVVDVFDRGETFCLGRNAAY